MNFKVSKLAQKDLEDIWVFTFQNWSKLQADKYYEILVSEIDKIYKYPEIGRKIDAVKIGHRIRRIKSHVKVYKVIKNKIWVDRILHKQMDILNQIKK